MRGLCDVKALQESNWRTIHPEVAPMGDDRYAVKHIFEKNLGPGDYETKLRSQNAYGWSEYSDVVDFQTGKF